MKKQPKEVPHEKVDFYIDCTCRCRTYYPSEMKSSKVKCGSCGKSYNAEG